MKSDRRVPVAIVGGGFSGTMLAAQLARRGVGSLLIEGGGRTGHGVAYSTDEPAHVLNVRAESMSAWPDDPDHFARASGDPKGFAERRGFGRYLRSILAEAVASGHVETVEDRAVAAVPDGGEWR
ncbi:MAG TPA: FAD/NAD(P)-binding protein, partial [Sphingomicrobium sp.]|nr:FAD/NAD(P)-binding protein [Sphingomicrobium sp.]